MVKLVFVLWQTHDADHYFDGLREDDIRSRSKPRLEHDVYGPNGELYGKAVCLVWPNGADFDPSTLHDWPNVCDELAARACGWGRRNQLR